MIVISTLAPFSFNSEHSWLSGVSPPPTSLHQGQSVWQIIYRRSNSINTKARSKKAPLILRCPHGLLLGEASHKVTGALEQSHGEACVERNQLDSTTSQTRGVSHLESRSSSPRQAFIWLQLQLATDYSLMRNSKMEPLKLDAHDSLTYRICERW